MLASVALRFAIAALVVGVCVAAVVTPSGHSATLCKGSGPAGTHFAVYWTPFGCLRARAFRAQLQLGPSDAIQFRFTRRGHVVRVFNARLPVWEQPVEGPCYNGPNRPLSQEILRTRTYFVVS